MKKSLFCFLVLIFFCFSSVLPLYAGKIIDKSEDGYFLFVPKVASFGEKFSILVCLPGWGIQAKQDINNWAFGAQKNNFVAIDLDVDYSLIKSGSDVNALYLRLAKIIDEVSDNYNIDKEKIYITGTSAGGMLAISLSLMFPEKFLASGVVSGGRLGFAAEDNLKNAGRCRFYIVHGQKDKSIPISEFKATKKQLEDNGAVIKFEIIPEGEHTLSSNVYKEAVNWLSKID